MAAIAPPAVGSVWINTPAHRWEDLHGIPTVLAFWSIGCDASIVLLRKLQALQHQFGASIQVIAVHSPRFEAGSEVEQVAETVASLKLSIPVLHDPQLETFHRYAPGGWPAAVFVQANQRVAGVVLGAESDIHADVVEHLKVQPSVQPPKFRVGYKPPRPSTELAWPSGVALLDGTGLVAISDRGHDRIVLAIADPISHTLTVTSILEGISAPGRLEATGHGSFVVTQPDAGTVLLVDPETRAVSPLCTGMVRPSAVCVDLDGSVLVADAGADKLFRIPADAVASGKECTPLHIAGSGFTGQSDGPAGRASLSQPNGMCRTTKGVLFADSGSHNVRILTNAGKVFSVTNNSPTHHGFVDGPAHEALLTRPADIAGRPDGSLVIVDQLNNRLRSLHGGSISTIGARGLLRPEAACALIDGSVIVADTGNHRLVLVDADQSSACVMRLDGMERVLSIGAAPTVRGNAGLPLRLGYPSPGKGPWEVSVAADPPELLVAPLRVVRKEPGGDVVVNLGKPGKGVLTVTSVSTGAERSIKLPLQVR